MSNLLWAIAGGFIGYYFSWGLTAKLPPMNRAILGFVLTWYLMSFTSNSDDSTS